MLNQVVSRALTRPELQLHNQRTVSPASRKDSIPRIRGEYIRRHDYAQRPRHHRRSQTGEVSRKKRLPWREPEGRLNDREEREGDSCVTAFRRVESIVADIRVGAATEVLIE